MGLSNPLSFEAWSSLISNLISRNGCVFGSIYIQITRGKAPRNHEFPKASCPTVFVMISESAAKTELEKVIAITAEDERWRGVISRPPLYLLIRDCVTWPLVKVQRRQFYNMMVI